LKIAIFNRQKDLLINKSSVRALVKEVLRFLKIECDEVSFYFVTQKAISKLHEEFFQDPTPTDCISFPIDKDHLGEIFVCPATAISYAKKKKLDPYKETSLYVIHGLLHLLGYDDLKEKARRAMRKKEKSCMRHLYKQNMILRRK
jgi:probable rRNA maturation factor